MTVIVVINKEYPRDRWVAVLDEAGLDYRGLDPMLDIFIIHGHTVDTFPLADHPAIKSIRNDGVVSVNFDQTLTLSASLNTDSWALARICRRTAPWPLTEGFPINTFYRMNRTGNDVDIYICDTGITATHEEIANLPGGFGGRIHDSYSGQSTIHFHGTAMASCAAGPKCGVAKNATIWDVRVLDSAGTGTDTAILDGLNAVLSHYNSRHDTNRPAIVNLSLGGTGDRTYEAAITNLIDAGVFVVASAGNENFDLDTLEYQPAEADVDNIVVGGTTAVDIPYYWGSSGSNYSPTVVTLLAPASTIYFGDNSADNAYGVASGTSPSAAFVSGVLALMMEGRNRIYSRDEVKAVRTELIDAATTGKLRPNSFGKTFPDRLLYADPNVAPRNDPLPEPMYVSTQRSAALFGTVSGNTVGIRTMKSHAVFGGASEDIAVRAVRAHALFGENYDLTLTNHSFESGDLTGWTQTGNWTVTTSTNLGYGTVNSIDGTYFARPLDDGTASPRELYQDVSVSAHATAIDASRVGVTMRVYHCGVASGNDQRNIALEFYDGASALLGSRITSSNHTGGYNLRMHFAYLGGAEDLVVPVGTRTIRAILIATWLTGTNVDSYFDNVQLTLRYK